MPYSKPRERVLIPLVAIVVSLVVGGGYLYWLGASPPGPRSPRYQQYVNTFQVGVAALDADLPQVAEEKLTAAIKLIPQEPIAWADRGLLYLRTGRLPEATADLQEAARLAPHDIEIEKLQALLLQRLGKLREATALLRQIMIRDPQDIRPIYLLAQIIDKEQQADSDSEFQRLMEQILAVRPNNLWVLADRLRVAVRRSDETAVNDTLKRFDELSVNWLERTRVELATLKKTLKESLGPQTVPRLLRFTNTLKGETRFASQVAEVQPKEEFAGTSLQTFRWLTPVMNSPAPYDAGLSFTPEEVSDSPAGTWDEVLPVWLKPESTPVLFVANQRESRRIADAPKFPAVPGRVVAIDWNNDLRTDMVSVGPAGLRFWQQQADGTFIDATAKTELPADQLKSVCRSALAADVDLDGDLDLLLTVKGGKTRFLRNTFDGTWTSREIFTYVTDPRAIVWGDFDHDGAPDAAMLDDQGKLHVFSNERSGMFKRWPADPPSARLLQITVADATDDGVYDIVALRDDGALIAISDRDQQSAWQVTELGQWPAIAGDKQAEISLLLAADFDNNGAVDLVASGPKVAAIWLGTGSGKYRSIRDDLPAKITGAADLRGGGRLDLLGVDAKGRPVVLRNAGGLNYHWQTYWPRMAKGEQSGDNRINSFGIGGDIEVRAGMSVVKQPIISPAVHVGLGLKQSADVVRVQWPNGSFQFEFSPSIDQPFVAEQRLKGSCPFLFAWNGERFAFVTDFMWSTPLGMYINASDKGGFLQTTDWVKIPGEQLAAKDGQYELRVNANLWETHFFDHMTLMSVDHPAETHMFVDERFFMEPSPPAFILTDKPINVARVTDDRGHDATPDVRLNDGVYFDHIQRGTFQGVSREHWVEVELGDLPPGAGPLWLVARGWMHPTDSSVNFSLEQGQHVKPRGLVLEIPDGNGGWKVARDKLGFPTGKNKTILVGLDGLGPDGTSPQRFRLRTNLEIYWDSLLIARGRDNVVAKDQTLSAATADLRFRGIVAMTQANPSSPELPHYDQLVSTGQHWRDLIGYHTRYGDIHELLQKIDDRYAIICAGDEVIMKFAAPDAPPKGWKRDFIWVADGWVKDGDYNTRFGKTVLPLPAHDMPSYNTPPGQLEDDPVYRRHPLDWEKYHTRYVTPHLFQQGLRGFRSPNRQE